MGEVLALLFVGFMVYIFMFPNTNSNSTSFRLGRGVGNKARKFGEWLTRDE